MDEVRMMLDKMEDVGQLGLIDNLQRLGLAYHFKDEVTQILNRVYNTSIDDGDLHTTSLQFRILRQHGYNVPLEYVNENKDSRQSHYLTSLVIHALELPSDLRMTRAEARWFIDVYEKKNDMSVVLLELAKLDFNLVQAKHLEDLKFASTWWVDAGLGKKLPFIRDRLTENFLWAVAMIPEPQFQHCRRVYTMLNSIITTIDDVYDVYGTLEELELFTDAVERVAEARRRRSHDGAMEEARSPHERVT
ncbi:hypothetical protein ACFE04_026657 [Oxalis oulophora]